tara:strand:+ start:1500 stop:1676 length:177 start_codon:yes stop_codon:yes gene_type:complete
MVNNLINIRDNVKENIENVEGELEEAVSNIDNAFKTLRLAIESLDDLSNLIDELKEKL